MESYKLPLYLGILIGLLVFLIPVFRLSTKIVTYLTIVVGGFLISGFLKFNATFTEVKEFLPYFGLLFFLSLITIINDLWGNKKFND